MSYELYKNLSNVNGKLRDEAEKEIYELWRTCFKDSISYTDFYFKYKIPYNEVLTILSKNQIVSMLHLNPYELIVRNQKVQCNYIVGVATDEAFRRLGLMKRLLDEALRTMYDQGMPFTYLMPALKEIYLPFDFQVVYEMEQWDNELFSYNKLLDRIQDSYKAEAETYKYKSVAASELNTKNTQQSSKLYSYYQEIDEEEIEVLPFSQVTELQTNLIQFTNEWLENHYDIYANRDAFYYERLAAEMKVTNGEILLAMKNGSICGYLAYMSEEYVHITEMIYEDIDVKEALFDEILKREDRTKIKEMEYYPSIMTRIVHLPSFVKYLKSNQKFSIVLQVKDDIIEKNNRVYHLTFDEYGCEIEETDKKAEVSGDIKSLTKLFFGQMTTSEMDELILSNEKNRIRDALASISSLQKLFINEVV